MTTPLSEADPLPAATPVAPTPVATIETDTFCERCGYNLLKQAVWRDERLQILVTRCPECGAFRAAGKSTGVGSLWLKRATTLMLFAWMLTVLAVWTGLGLLAGFQYVLATASYDEWFHSTDSSALYFLVLASAAGVLVGFVAGSFTTNVLWHAKPAARSVAFLVPIAASLLLMLFWLANFPTHADWVPVVLVVQTLIEMFGVLLGIALGRKFSRSLLSLLFPPGPLQHVAFLWTVDRLTPPALQPSNRPAP